MLVDDDYATNLFHKIILEDENLVDQIIVCNSVDDAFEKLNDMKEGPEFIFLDMNMPMKNAWDFLDAYDPSKFINTKIVILSTTKNPHDVEKANNNDKVYGFLTKPLDLNYLKSHIQDQ